MNITGWSAALAFAPVRRPVKTKAKTVTPARVLPAGAEIANVASTATVSATAVIFAESELRTGDQKRPAEPAPEQPSGLGWGKKIKPPSMVLDEDVNGFKAKQKKKNGNAGVRKRKGKKASIFNIERRDGHSAKETRISKCRISRFGIQWNSTIQHDQTTTSSTRHGRSASKRRGGCGVKWRGSVTRAAATRIRIAITAKTIMIDRRRMVRPILLLLRLEP